MNQHSLEHSHEHLHQRPIDSILSNAQIEELSRRELFARAVGITGATIFTSSFLAACGSNDLVSNDGTLLPSASDTLTANNGGILGPATGDYDTADRLTPPEPPKEPVILVPPGSLVVDGDRNLKVVSYQIDDIPGRIVSRAMMDVCDREGVPGALGNMIVGIYAELYLEAVQEMAYRGYPIHNHSRTHSYDIATNINELDYMQAFIKRITGKDNRLFTNPGGSVNRSLLDALKARGMYYRWVSYDLGDWKIPRPTPEQLATRHRSALGIYRQFLLHGSDSNGPTLQALPQIFRDAKSLGFQIVSPEEHMSMGTPMVRAMALLDTQTQLLESYVTEGKFAGISELEANWLLTLETSLNDSVNLSKEKTDVLKKEIKNRKKALGIL
jgi:peptidoglycan/xylan/chitin deacetylase (PgdA/CDA1 family)